MSRAMSFCHNSAVSPWICGEFVSIVCNCVGDSIASRTDLIFQYSKSPTSVRPKVVLACDDF